VKRLLADTLFEKGDRDAAVERYQALLEEYRNDWRLHERLARAYASNGRWSEARAEYDAVLRLNATHVPALNGRGLAAYRLGDTSAAAEDFHESLLLKLHQPMTVYALALCLVESDPEMARTLFEHAVESDPDLYGAWLGIARIAERANQWSDAVDAYESALRVENDSAVRARLAYVAVRAGLFEVARPILSELVASAGRDARLQYLLGYCCYQQGELDEAAQHWRSALLEDRDPLLENDLAWLHVCLADRAAEARNRAEMTQHWNTALDRSHDVDMGSALIPRWAREALLRLQYPESRHPASRDFQIAHDLMTDVLAHDDTNPVYRILTGLCAARMGDWSLCGELVEPLIADARWGAMSAYLSAICLSERNLPDEAIARLDPYARNWGEWETEVQAFRVQIYLTSSDVERTARELAMLRAQSRERCPNDLAIAVLLGLRVWRHAYDLVMELPSEERSALARYAVGVASLMLRRETEGIERLEQVPAGSEWGSAARVLRLTGIKRRALRAFHSLGWREVADSLEEVLRLDEDDATVREWLDRARVFAMLTERRDDSEETLTAHWRDRLRERPNDALPLHQWAVYAYWAAQESTTHEPWRCAMSLWGSLLNLEEYWVRWTIARASRHDPDAWGPSGDAETRSREIVVNLRRRLMEQLIADMTDAVLRSDPMRDVDDFVLDFLREYQTSALWREWLESNPTLVETVPPFGGDLLERLGRLDDARSILATREKIEPTSCGERLLIYLSPLGSLLAAAETDNSALAQTRARELFNSPDPAERRVARIVFVVATRQSKPTATRPREGLERALTAMLAAKEVASSLLVSEMDWTPVLTRLSDGVVAEVEALGNRPPDDRLSEAETARELLKRVYETTRISALIHAIVRVTLFEARAYLALAKRGRRAMDDPYFAPEDADALGLIQEALGLAPDHVTLQQEAAQLRLRRGLVAAQEGRLNEALIDLARAHELDPVSHRITTAYANFMMEQAARVWMENRADAQREALALAYRVLQADPTDSHLLSRCARFLDLPENHPLRETPEYRRLLALFMRQTTNDES
jgi:tetratricopeptide (TPR) repeat protein